MLAWKMSPWWMYSTARRDRLLVPVRAGDEAERAERVAGRALAGGPAGRGQSAARRVSSANRSSRAAARASVHSASKCHSPVARSRRSTWS